MQTHDHEPSLEEAHSSATRRGDEGEAIASLALGAGKPGALDAGAVMHLQRAAGNANVAALLGEEREEAGSSPVHDVVGSGGGTPLDASTRKDMESRLGHDFGDVRVHTDDKAAASAKAVNAHAYTVGSNVVFQRDRYAPETDAGRRMLAHELTHVVQQRSGPVDGTPAPGGIRVSDPSDRFEREAEWTADQVMAAQPPDSTATSPVAAPPVGVQRQEEEEELQGSFVQRQEEEEELQGSFVQRQEDKKEEEEPEEMPS